MLATPNARTARMYKHTLLPKIPATARISTMAHTMNQNTLIVFSGCFMALIV